MLSPKIVAVMCSLPHGAHASLSCPLVTRCLPPAEQRCPIGDTPPSYAARHASVKSCFTWKSFFILNLKRINK